MSDAQSRDGLTGRSVSRRDVMRGAVVLGGAAATGGLVAPGTASAERAAPKSSGRTTPNGFGDWLGTVTQVLDIGGKVLDVFLLARNGEQSEPLDVGGVQFQVLDLGGGAQVYATNKTDDELGLCFSVTGSEPGENTSVYQPLSVKGAYSCINDLKDFADGQVYLAPSPTTTTADGKLVRALNFAARSLLLGKPIKVVTGVNLTVIREDKVVKSFVAEIAIDAPQKVLKAEIRATGQDGTTMVARWESTGGFAKANDVISIPFPAGVNLDPVVEEIQVSLDLDPAGLDEAIKERRERIIQL